jgi:hypothetical protein
MTTIDHVLHCGATPQTAMIHPAAVQLVAAILVLISLTKEFNLSSAVIQTT